MENTCENIQEQILELITGDLSAEKAAELRHHISRCSACSKYLKALQGDDRLLGDFVEVMQPTVAGLEQNVIGTLNRSTSDKAANFASIWRIIMESKITKLAAAAAIVIVVLIGIHQFGGSIDGATPAFADIVRPILTARTATFKIAVNMIKGQPSQVFKGMFMEPGRMRQEMEGEVIAIIDMQEGKIVTLMPEEKTAMVMEVENIPDENKYQNQVNMFFEIRRRIKQAQDDEDKSVEFLGEQEIDGRTAIGYRAQEAGQDVVVWADSESLLPIRIESSMPIMMDRQITVIMYDFALDIALDESLFSLEIPEGYTVQTMQMDVSRPKEEDLLEMFRLWTETTDGRFPSALDVNSIREFIEAPLEERKEAIEFDEDQELSFKQVHEEFSRISQQWQELTLPRRQLWEEYKKSSEPEERKERLQQWREEYKKTSQREKELLQEMKEMRKPMNEAMEREREAIKRWYEKFDKPLPQLAQEIQNTMTLIVRGIMFAQMLPADSDWHYAGKDVKLGDVDTAIFWHRPADSETYRVIYGDLSVKDVAPENLPK